MLTLLDLIIMNNTLRMHLNLNLRDGLIKKNQQVLRLSLIFHSQLETETVNLKIFLIIKIILYII
jgi:hypothetical protein